MKGIFRSACAVLIMMAMLGVTASAQKKTIDSKTNYAREVLQPFVDSGQLPGAICVFYKDGVQETCCIGYADASSRRRINMDNAFMQCSQTKGFCGVTIAKLVEEGKITLDDPVSKYLPEFAELWILESEEDGVKILRKAKNVLTVRMVLNHTGGFPFEVSAKRNDVRGGGWSGGAPIRQVAAIAAASPIMFEPGTHELYSNTGIDIGAAIVEVVTGMKWEEYLKQEVLDPLGMKSTSFWPTDKQIKNKIELYQFEDNAPAKWVEEMAWQQRPYNDAHVFASAGAGLWTTAADQLKFYKMLMNLGLGENGVRILKEETVKSILAVTTRPENMGGYSLGLSAPVNDDENLWFGHGGAWGTNCSVNWHKKQLKLWVVQRAGGPQPWEAEVNKAAEKFFSQSFNRSGVSEYTGRIGSMN
jgi:CubicO group peptidase (beta-lactamase class C family)